MPPMRSSFTSGPSLQPGDGSVDVLGVVPAEEVRVSLAAVVAARVEQEHAVAMADEHAGLRQLPLPGRVRDDCGAVPRRHVPGGEVEAVTGPHGHLLVGPPELGRLDIRTRAVGGQDRDRDRDDEPVGARTAANAIPARRSAAKPAGLARAPEESGRAPDEQETPTGESKKPVQSSPRAPTARASATASDGSLERERTETVASAARPPAGSRG